MTARRATSLLLAVAQVSTGVYLIVYLYRWQWNRALITGILFLATEVLLIGRLVLQRLRSIEDRLAVPASPPDPAGAVAVHRTLVDLRPAPTDRFAWIRDAATSRTNVFLPVLLGAGVVASALAWAVETVARRTARPAMEHALVDALGPIAFPTAGFLAAPGPARPAPRRSPGRWIGLSVAAVAVVVGIGAGIDVVADATQTRPDRLERGVTTIVDVRLRGARASERPTAHAADLFAACRNVFSRDVPTAAVLDRGAGRVRVVLDSDIGRHGRERLEGCLQDTTIDRLQAVVTEVVTVPPPKG